MQHVPSQKPHTKAIGLVIACSLEANNWCAYNHRLTGVLKIENMRARHNHIEYIHKPMRKLSHDHPWILLLTLT